MTYSDVSLMIDGAWTKGANGRTIPVINPARCRRAKFVNWYVQLGGAACTGSFLRKRCRSAASPLAVS